MGLLAWFRRPKLLAVECWIDDASRWRGLARGVAEDSARGANVLVCAQFKQALAAAGERLAQAGIPFEIRLRWTAAETERLLGPGDPTVTATLVSCLPQVAAATPAPPKAGARPLSIRVADVHVLAAENDRVVRFAASLPAPVTTTASVSFDDPLLQTFARPWVRSMLARLGMSADEAIASPMVTKGIHRALAKLAAKATGNVPCDSIEEWLRRNLRS